MQQSRRRGTSASTTERWRGRSTTMPSQGSCARRCLRRTGPGPPTTRRRGQGRQARSWPGASRQSRRSLTDALDALGLERERADALERRLELVEGRQAGEPDTEQPAGEPETEQPTRAPGMEQTAAEGTAVPAPARDYSSTHRPAWSRSSRLTASRKPSARPPHSWPSGGACGARMRSEAAPSSVLAPRSTAGSWSSR